MDSRFSKTCHTATSSTKLPGDQTAASSTEPPGDQTAASSTEPPGEQKASSSTEPPGGQGFNSPDSSDHELEFQKDLQMAMTLSMLDQFQCNSSHAVTEELHCVTAKPTKPCTDDLDTDSDLYRLSDFESPTPSREPSPPPYLRKISEIIPVINELSSSEPSRVMSPLHHKQDMAGHGYKRPLAELNPLPAKRHKVDSRRSSADSQGSHRSQGSGCSSIRSLRQEKDRLMLDNLPRVPCLTRRQSRELSRIIHGQSSQCTIHSSLDPSIFDPEISDCEDDDGKLELLPEVKEELQQLLEPAELDATYEESEELRDYSSSSDDPDELPDLILLSSDEEPAGGSTAQNNTNKRISHTPLSNVTPVFDKLQFRPHVVLKDCMPTPQIKKKLKLKSQPDKGSNDGSSDKECPASSASEEEDSSSYDSSKVGIPSSKLVWTSQQHHKLLDICSKVQIKLSRCDNLIRQRCRDEDTTSVSSDGKRERHFTDVLSTSTSCSQVSVDSDRESQSLGGSVNSWLSSNFESDISESESDSEVDEDIQQRRKLVSRTHTGPGRLVLATTQNVPKAAIQHRPQCSRALLSLGPSLHATLEAHGSATSRASEPRRSVKPMNMHMADMISSSDVEGDKYQLRYLNMCESNISPWAEPTIEIVQQIFQFLLNTKSQLVARKSYDMLSIILDTHRSCHPHFDWEVLESVVDKLMLPLGIQNSPIEELYGPVLALKYLVSLLESDLLYQAGAASSADSKPSNQGSLHRHILKSLAFHWLSLERGSRRVARVVEWTVASLSYGQHLTPSLQRPSTLASFSPCRAPRACPHARVEHIPRVLTLFQRLLHLAVVVSRRSDNSLHKLVSEIVRGFMHTPIAFHRHLLLSTVTSPILKFKIVQLILDDYGTSAGSGCSSLSITLKGLFLTYSHCEPPITTLTPPLTPSDHDDSCQGDVSAAGQPTKKYSPESVEELSFLMWLLVSSYFQIRKPAQGGESLRHLEGDVETLRHRYQSMTSEITPKTEMYLQMLLGLTNLVSS